MSSVLADTAQRLPVLSCGQDFERRDSLKADEGQAYSRMYLAGLRPVRTDLRAFASAAEMPATASNDRTHTIAVDSVNSPSGRISQDAATSSSGVQAHDSNRLSGI